MIFAMAPLCSEVSVLSAVLSRASLACMLADYDDVERGRRAPRRTGCRVAAAATRVVGPSLPGAFGGSLVLPRFSGAAVSTDCDAVERSRRAWRRAGCCVVAAARTVVP